MDLLELLALDFADNRAKLQVSVEVTRCDNLFQLVEGHSLDDTVEVLIGIAFCAQKVSFEVHPFLVEVVVI